MKLKIINIFLLLFSIFLSATAREYKPSEIVNPNIADRREYVADPGNYLSSEAKQAINSRLAALRASTTAEVGVAVVPDLGDLPIEEFSEEVFTSWGLGKKDVDNGVLFLISPESRKVRIQTGYGTEGVLPDIVCKGLIDSYTIPAMKDGDIDKAVVSTVGQIAEIMSDETYAEELKSKYADNYGGVQPKAAVDSSVIENFIMIVAIIFFFASMILYFRDLSQIRKGSLNEKALRWRVAMWPLFGLGFLSAGAGLIFGFLALYHYRRARTHKRICPKCGHKMNRMSEERDNDFLNDAQDLEEKLGTVDYDVWVCPECGTIEKVPFIERQLKYTECPNCHTIAMGPIADNILVQPTIHREGVGEKVSECRYCHHRKNTRYRIPRRDNGAALAAGAAIGTMLGSRGNGGGGGFGGGFGGGSTGGGGASGGW